MLCYIILYYIYATKKWILKNEVWLQGLFFKANCQKAELWIDKKKLKICMKINIESKKG